MEKNSTSDEIIKTLGEIGDDFDLSLKLSSQMRRQPPPVCFAKLHVLIDSMRMIKIY